MTTVVQVASSYTHRHRNLPPVGRSVYMYFKGVGRVSYNPYNIGSKAKRRVHDVGLHCKCIVGGAVNIVLIFYLLYFYVH